MIDKPISYFSYLLRVWQAGEKATDDWQASLESPHTGERQGFGDLASLFAFLVERTACDRESEAGSGPEKSPFDYSAM